MESAPDTGFTIGAEFKPSIRTLHCHSFELTCLGTPTETTIRLWGSFVSTSSRRAMIRPICALEGARDFDIAGRHKKPFL